MPQSRAVKEMNAPDTATSDLKLAAIINDKRAFAARWQGSVRSVDGLLAQGLPHLKIGKRRVRIIVAEADAWMRERFGTRRLGPVKAAEPPQV